MNINKLFTIFSKKPVAREEFAIKEDDVFLVSYPKSGNTWLKFILANLYSQDQEIGFKNVHGFCPEFDNATGSEILTSPRFFKSHSKGNHDFPNVIYIARDGRDVAVSYFYYLKKIYKIDADLPFNEFLKDFNAGGGLYGLWSEHVNFWLEKYQGNILLIKYEDLILDIEKEVKKILKFINKDFSEEKIRIAIEASSFSNLAKLEKKDQKKDPYLNKTDLNIPFVRSGQCGEYQNYFDEQMKEEFMKIHISSMKSLQYI